MATEREVVEDLFEAALSLSPLERAQFLDRKCEGAPEVRHAVEVLLAADDQAGNFLETPLIQLLSGDPSLLRDSGPVAGEQEAESSAFQAGSTIAGRFTLHRLVARGGMGEVWEAWDAQLQERVAIKTILPDLAGNPEAVERFRLEVKQARAISHPNVCRIHELFTFEMESGRPVMFLSMEFLEGPTLSEYLRHHGPFEPSAAYELVRQLVQGLNCAHSLGVVHRDLKSRNIMLVNSGPGKMRAVITDFGLALNVLTPDGGLQEREGQGTPAYMAPEQKLTGNVTVSADQYALGVVMYEMLTGSRPLRTDSRSLRKAGGSRVLAKPIPTRWAQVLERCLASRPEDRFPSLDDLLQALEPPRPTRWFWVAAVAAACLATLGAVYSVWYRHPPAVTSLAVLPLHNGNADSKLDYMGAGITEALTNDLAEVPGLQVKAESIAERVPSENVELGKLGKRLNVSSLVSGSFTYEGSHLRIPVEIIDVSTGFQIWGKTYEGDVSNLAELQNEISTDVAYHLKIRLDPDLKARLKRQYSTVPAAYDAYLKGRYSLKMRTPEDLRQAVTDFQTSLAADPHYAPAYAGLADSLNLLAHYGSEHQVSMMKNALQAADQALSLDSTLGEAYASRALSRTLLNYEWKQAEGDYVRALELNPGYLNARIWYALALLTPLGRNEEAEGQLSYAKTSAPDSMLTTISLATAAKCGRREAQSARMLEEHFESIQHFEPAVDLLAADYLVLKRPHDAITLLQKTAVEHGEERERAISISIAYAQAGDAADAAKSFDAATRGEGEENSLLYEAAIYYTALGNYTRAMDSLEAAYARRDPDLLFVNVDPLLANLHSAPRFKKLLHQMNLE